jgi:D-alanine-D-alanine ligase
MMQEFGRVAVLMGGASSEREVSLKSGQAVLEVLCAQGVDAFALIVESLPDLMAQLAESRADRVFNVLHGGAGEDGRVQALLQMLGLPFTGSGPLACAIAMDKLRTKWLWMGAGLPTPGFNFVSPFQALDRHRLPAWPLVVKPACEGSSVGIHKVERADQLDAALEDALRFDDSVLLERFIAGQELTVAILGDQALPIIQIQPKAGFYDYQAKYLRNDTLYFEPDLPAALKKQIQHLALRAFQVLGACGWGRIDVMLDADLQPWLLEANLVPGMTDHSLVPMAAKAGGIEFDALVLRLLSQTLAPRIASESRP